MFCMSRSLRLSMLRRVAEVSNMQFRSCSAVHARNLGVQNHRGDVRSRVGNVLDLGAQHDYTRTMIWPRNNCWRRFVAAFYVVAIGVTPAAATVTFNDPTVTDQDHFGYAADLHGNHVIIGASGDDTFGIDVGQAHLFDLSGNFVRTFDDPTPTEVDSFGIAVALDGKNVLIGADRDDTNGDRVGQAHLFDVNGTLLQTFDDPTPTKADRFGRVVAIEGDNVLIGAWGDDTNGVDVGQAHLFDLSGNLRHTFDDPTPTDKRDGFGFSVALDGNHVLIGATNHDNSDAVTDLGKAYLFDLDGNLLQTFSDPSPTGGDRFGSSVALDGNYVVVGNHKDDTNGFNVGQAHLFDLNGNLLHTFEDPTPTTEDRFGRRVALEGSNVLIGDFADDTSGTGVGRTHLFDLSGDLLQTFKDPSPTDGDRFGTWVALEGNNILIGAWKDDTLGMDVGQVHLFTYSHVLGDFDGDGVLDIDDINKLSEESAGDLHDRAFDLNDDGTVDQKDLRMWIYDLKNSFIGDSNLDGEFSSGDLVSVFQSGEYEDDVPSNSSWETGDWDGDGEFGTSDLVLAFQDGGFEVGPRPMAVPESTSRAWTVCMWLCLLVCLRATRRIAC